VRTTGGWAKPFGFELVRGLVWGLVALAISACGSSGGEESVPNTVPTADAGLPQNAATGQTMYLDGRNSFDNEDDTLSYLWVLTSSPSGSQATLSDDTSPTPTFVADVDGVYLLTLVVNDGTVSSEESTMTVTSKIPGTNTVPVADAGDARFIRTGDEFTLNGNGSSDADGDPLTYTWLLTTKPLLSIAKMVDADTITPSFTPDLNGGYIFELIVSDGFDRSLPHLVTLTASDNNPPVADAGNDQTIRANREVTLDGSGSSDLDGDPLTYLWSYVSVPNGALEPTLNGATTAAPTFTPDEGGTYRLQLVVNDGETDSLADIVTITSNGNTIPVAVPGLAQTVYTGEEVNLNGSNSFDVENDPLTFQWGFASAPSGSNAAFSGGTTATPRFTPNIDGDYVVQLVVNDGEDDSDIVTVTITSVTNTPPTANAGLAQDVMTEVLVNLDGSNSSDINGDALTFLWIILSAPAGSTATLTNATTATPSFTPDLNGEYVFTLVVNDGLLDSAGDNVTITSTGLITYAVVDTNQTTCYNSATGNATGCSGVGHDADYSGFQANYTVSNGGTIVTDNITELVWQQSTDQNNDGNIDYADKLSQTNAVSYCNNLTLASRSDWRLPNVKELYSLMLFSGRDASSYLGTDTNTLTPFISNNFDWAFGDITTTDGINAGDRIIDGQYVTSSLNVAKTMVNDDSVFGVNFVDGRIKAYPTFNKVYYVRCVAGNTSYGVNDFSDNGDQTVSDEATGLMWQKNDIERANWDDAISECEGASTAAHTDWRLPNVKELQSIVHYSRSPDTNNSPALDPVFISNPILNEESIADWGYYWASTTHVDNNGDGTNATYISFGRALGYVNTSILDVHGAGAQRSNDKLDVANEAGALSAAFNGVFYYKGPQGDILRLNNKVRCVRNIN